MRIAQVSYHTNPVAPLGGRHTGGMNIYVSELARELARRGHHVDIFTRLDGERPEVTALAPNLRLVQLAAGPPAPLEKELLTPFVSAFAAEMARFAANEGETYDLVHSHYWQGIAAGEPFARAQGAPHLVMFHTLGEVKNRARVSEEEPRERIRRERDLAASADAIISACAHEHDLLARYYDADPARMVSIPCGIDTDLFRPRDRDECRRALDIDRDRPVLLWVGRLEKLKGVDILIDAVAQLDEPDVLLLVVGGDEHGRELRAELEEQAQRGRSWRQRALHRRRPPRGAARLVQRRRCLRRAQLLRELRAGGGGGDGLRHARRRLARRRTRLDGDRRCERLPDSLALPRAVRGEARGAHPQPRTAGELRAVRQRVRPALPLGRDRAPHGSLYEDVIAARVPEEVGT